MRGSSEFSWRRHRALTATLLLATLLAMLFGLRLAASAIHWSARREPPIADWMTLGFVARSWDLDRDGLEDALGVETAPGERVTLAEVAERTGRPLAEVKAVVETTIADAKLGHNP